jgi:hypothetical protein
MGAVALFVIAVAPGLFILWYIHHKDKYEPEPKGLIVATFFIGVGAAVPASLLEILFEWGTGIPTEGNIPGAFIDAFLVVAPAEEIAKYLSVRVKAYRSPAFNEVMDGIVYSVAAALGFATIENILYVYQLGFAVGILRAVCSVPMHALCGAVIGYYLAFHGAYDFVLFTGTFLGFLIIPIMFWLYRIYRRRLLLALAGSPFRGARDEYLFTSVSRRRTPAGIIKIGVGVILLSFSSIMTIGAVASVTRGDVFSGAEYGALVFLILVPLIVGALLFLLARKDVVTR